MPNMVTHTCDHSLWKAEAERTTRVQCHLSFTSKDGESPYRVKMLEQKQGLD